jgi:hypothetical protein
MKGVLKVMIMGFEGGELLLPAVDDGTRLLQLLT